MSCAVPTWIFLHRSKLKPTSNTQAQLQFQTPVASLFWVHSAIVSPTALRHLFLTLAFVQNIRAFCFGDRLTANATPSREEHQLLFTLTHFTSTLPLQEHQLLSLPCHASLQHSLLRGTPAALHLHALLQHSLFAKNTNCSLYLDTRHFATLSLRGHHYSHSSHSSHFGTHHFDPFSLF